MRVAAIAIALVLLFPACSSTDPEGEGLPPATAYVGAANVLGFEFKFGQNAFGAGLTYRRIHDWEAPPVEESEPPFIHPPIRNEK
jgi:hypothetical protein